MRWFWTVLVALLVPQIGMADSRYRFAIDGEPLVAADLYLYTGPDQRTWMATVADGTAEIPDSTVATTLREATGQWQWVIVTADELVYASTSQPAARHDWKAALAGMGDAADNDALVNLPPPIELDVTVVRADGGPAAHAYGSIERVFDHAGPCGQAQTLSPMRFGISAGPDGRLGWRLAPGRYQLFIDEEHHAIELMDDDDPQRTRSLRIELSEQRPLHLRALTTDGRAATGLLLGRYAGDCMLRNYGTTDADGRLSVNIPARDLVDVVLSGRRADGQPLRQSLGERAATHWHSGDEYTIVWEGQAIDAADLSTPTVSVEAALPNLIAVRFEPSTCSTGSERGRCRYEFCRAEASGTCLSLLGPDAEGRYWARTDAGTSLRWKVRAVPTEDLLYWRASPWTTPVTLQMPAPPERPPAAPDQCRAEAVTPYSVSITWRDRSDDEYGFDMSACLGDSPEVCHRMALIDHDDDRFVLNGLPAATALTFRLHAFNPAGASASCTMTASTPRDVDLDAARKDWDARYGQTPDDPQAEVAYVEVLDKESAFADYFAFDEGCTSRRELLSSVYPHFILDGQRQFKDLAIDVYWIDQSDSPCPRGGCGLQAYGISADQPECYRWLGELVHEAAPTSTPPRPTVAVELSDGFERLRWFHTDSGVEVDHLELCGNDGGRPGSELVPPYQLDRYGRPIRCQSRPWQWPDEIQR